MAREAPSRKGGKSAAAPTPAASVVRPHVDSFEAVMTREDRTKGFFVGFDYSDDALREIDAFFRKCGKVIVALTVREILDEELARKLA
jgi:hypothetical protein